MPLAESLLQQFSQLVYCKHLICFLLQFQLTILGYYQLLFAKCHEQFYDEIVDAAQKTQVDIKVKKHWWHFGNTNPLVGREQITVSKTGFINQSGGCVVMKIKNRVVVLLGSRNTHTRFPEAKTILAST